MILTEKFSFKSQHLTDTFSPDFYSEVCAVGPNREKRPIGVFLQSPAFRLNKGLASIEELCCPEEWVKYPSCFTWRG
jgi:hypothetical protein